MKYDTVLYAIFRDLKLFYTLEIIHSFFHEQKLLRLRDLMKTISGRRLADERHHFMEQFLERFHAEIAGRA